MATMNFPPGRRSSDPTPPAQPPPVGPPKITWTEEEKANFLMRQRRYEAMKRLDAQLDYLKRIGK